MADPESPRAKSLIDELGSGLETIVNGFKAIPKSIMDAAEVTYYTAKAGLLLAAGSAVAALSGPIGWVNAFTMGAGMPIGTYISKRINEEQITYKEIANDIGIGALMGGIVSNVFSYFIHPVGNYVGAATKASYGATTGFAAQVGAKASMGVVNVSPMLRSQDLIRSSVISDYQARPWDEVTKEVRTTQKWLWPTISANLGLVNNVPANVGIATGNTIAYSTIRNSYQRQAA